MSQHVQRNIDSALRTGLTRTQLWEAADKGLIKCGKSAASAPPVSRPRPTLPANELPVLGWERWR